MLINITVSADSLADVLGEMREWLDTNHLSLGAFRYTKKGPDHAIIHVQCEDRDREQAELFKARFQNHA